MIFTRASFALGLLVGPIGLPNVLGQMGSTAIPLEMQIPPSDVVIDSDEYENWKCELIAKTNFVTVDQVCPYKESSRRLQASPPQPPPPITTPPNHEGTAADFLEPCYALPPDPVAEGWTALTKADDYFETVSLGFNFPLYGTANSLVHVSTNGFLSIGNQPQTFFASTDFPFTFVPMVAPFWADIDTRDPPETSPEFGDINGQIWYKSFDDHMAVIYDRVGYWNRRTDKRNTFQAVISDGASARLGAGTNVCFCYVDMDWTTGGSLGDQGGFGSPSNVGINGQSIQDFVQIGRFNRAGTDYDGPGRDSDGVDWLDNQGSTLADPPIQGICFDAIDATNVPPVATGFPVGDAYAIPCRASMESNLTFATPETDQTISVVLPTNLPVGLTITADTTTPSASVAVTVAWTPGAGQGGTYTLAFTATDTWTTPASITKTLTIVVADCGGADTDTPSVAPVPVPPPNKDPPTTPYTISAMPSSEPSYSPSGSALPSGTPSTLPTVSAAPSGSPSVSVQPSSGPTFSVHPSAAPTISSMPTSAPTRVTAQPSAQPSVRASEEPSDIPSYSPSGSDVPSDRPTGDPSSVPSYYPTATATGAPSRTPTSAPTRKRYIAQPAAQPSNPPSPSPSEVPSFNPTVQPVTVAPTPNPTPAGPPLQECKDYDLNSCLLIGDPAVEVPADGCPNVQTRADCSGWEASLLHSGFVEFGGETTFIYNVTTAVAFEHATVSWTGNCCVRDASFWGTTVDFGLDTQTCSHGSKYSLSPFPGQLFGFYKLVMAGKIPVVADAGTVSLKTADGVCELAVPGPDCSVCMDPDKARMLVSISDDEQKWLRGSI